MRCPINTHTDKTCSFNQKALSKYCRLQLVVCTSFSRLKKKKRREHREHTTNEEEPAQQTRNAVLRLQGVALSLSHSCQACLCLACEESAFFFRSRPHQPTERKRERERKRSTASHAYGVCMHIYILVLKFCTMTLDYMWRSFVFWFV